MAQESTRQHSIPLEILDDLATRFIINLPESMRKDLIRICFQMEMAHWFYTDEYLTDEAKAASFKPRLRSCNMREFAVHMFRHIHFLRGYSDDVDTIIDDWRQYKLSVPTYGAIMLNEDLTRVVLVQSYWNRTSWGFPKGKVNEEEAPHLCAVREVFEETGYSIASKIDPDQFTEQDLNDQTSRLYFVTGVPSNTVFGPRTKCEIRDIQWFPLDSLPSSKKDPIPDGLGLTYNSLYMVMPFIRATRKWVAAKKRGGGRRRSTQQSGSGPQHHHQTVALQKGGPVAATKEQQLHFPAFESPQFMPKAWMNFRVKKKDLFQAMDQL